MTTHHGDRTAARTDGRLLPWCRIIRSVALDPEPLLSLHARLDVLYNLCQVNRDMEHHVCSIGRSELAAWEGRRNPEGCIAVQKLIDTNLELMQDGDMLNMAHEHGLCMPNDNFRIDFVEYKAWAVSNPSLAIIHHGLHREEMSVITLNEAYSRYGLRSQDWEVIELIRPYYMFFFRASPSRGVSSYHVMNACLQKHGSSRGLEEYKGKLKRIADAKACCETRRQLLRMRVYDSLRGLAKTTMRSLFPVCPAERGDKRSRAASESKNADVLGHHHHPILGIDSLLAMPPAERLDINTHISMYGKKGRKSDIDAAMRGAIEWKSEIERRSKECLTGWFRGHYDMVFRTGVLHTELAPERGDSCGEIASDLADYIFSGRISEPTSRLKAKLLDRGVYQSSLFHACIAGACHAAYIAFLPELHPDVDSLRISLSSSIDRQRITVERALSIIHLKIPRTLARLEKHHEVEQYLMLPPRHPLILTKTQLLSLVLSHVSGGHDHRMPDDVFYTVIRPLYANRLHLGMSDRDPVRIIGFLREHQETLLQAPAQDGCFEKTLDALLTAYDFIDSSS